MAIAGDTQKFSESCQKADKYPLNLVLQGASTGSLLAQRAFLRENAGDLFLQKSTVPLLEFRGEKSIRNSVTAKILRSDEDFKDQFPDLTNRQQSTTRCRFVFLQAASSQAKLDVRLAHAKRIFTCFQVMPAYIDFVSVFAVKRADEEDISDIRFSSFREHVSLSDEMRGLNLPQLGLSGRGYQLSYNLKSVANTAKEYPARWTVVRNNREQWSWSIRQAVFHHQFDIEHGTTLWILTTARNYIQTRVEQLTGQTHNHAKSIDDETDFLEPRPQDRDFSTTEASFRASLAVHLVLAQYASEDWRGYLRWLEVMIEKMTGSALTMTNYNPDMFKLTAVQITEDKINKAVLTLNANARVLESLDSFYRRLLDHPEFQANPRYKGYIDHFSMQLRDYVYDTRMFSERAQTLGKIVGDRKNLVQQRLQARATDRVEKLTLQQHLEAKIMRVIAVMTLIYLPATFVSTFFSTDIVKYQNGGGSGGSSGPKDGSSSDNGNDSTSFSGLALARWFEVTIPLTVLTFSVAIWWYYFWEPWNARLRAWWRGEDRPKDPEKMI
ncbi:hypothetical protein B0T24DRAFT_636007 [Lasiosphaeria ovina]|uniref:CorA-like transporter domain-containing protein n=1 Tax=Lasiosphaeria ovina TaxID=92902 RepID=A0AAE0JWC0_9PEZI|nr:hypothetical protein B0T24DRAFT_636007 [Lasiosphaeria ovina]